ncbi:MAG TPA: helix-turn-helix transcriptional regulator [Tissierellaceae bacterium]|nr:helix-turn-helix transcriptional regulator [Tissierellaceae bacterium]
MNNNRIDPIESSLDLINIGQRIRIEREKLGITRERFAEIVNLSPFYIGQIERGERSMSLDTLDKISKALKISLDYIITGNVPYHNHGLVLESIEDYYGRENSEELEELLDLLFKLPQDKIALINDIIKILLPHLNMQ